MFDGRVYPGLGRDAADSIDVVLRPEPQAVGRGA
jgi:hypothetical protein